MQINRNNCEAFFLDYYEGTLSEGQVAEMFAFLKANPDLREIFESFGDVTLDSLDDTSESPIPSSQSRVPNPDPDSYRDRTPDFSFLKKEPGADPDSYRDSQAEQWMMDYLEGVISDDDRNSLEKYFASHPEKRNDLAILEKTKLHADADESLGDISFLKKKSEITADNFDDYAIASVEGTISASEQKLLNDFVAAQPEFALQLANYGKTKLESDQSVQLADKSFLKKSALVVNEENISELLVAKSEGELAAHEEAAVDEYISRFPEYKLELEQISRAKLLPDVAEVFEGKEKLKRGNAIINETNFEHYLVSASEGLLNRDELKAFNAFVSANPKYRKTIAVYAATRLQPDLSIVYEDKESLKRKVGGGTVWWSVNIRYAAAAAVVVLILGFYLWMKFASSTGDAPVNPVANNDRRDENMVTPDKIADVIKSPGDGNPSNIPDWTPNKTGDNDINKMDINHKPIAVIDNPFVPVTIVADHVPNKANDAVNFSDALYSVVFNPVVPPPAIETEEEYITPGQYAMRWMKNKIDGPDPNEEKVNQVLVENKPEEDKNVDGLDLTESAVNRVGETAANGNISMDQRDDGTYLHIWNYSVRVGGAN